MRPEFFDKLNTKRLVQLVFVFGMLLLSVTVATISFDHINGEKFVEVNELHVIQDNTIVMGNNCTAIVAQTSPERARSITLGLRGIINVRPNTHDILSDVLDGFNITLERVKVTKFKDNMYLAKMILRNRDKILKLDSKPSDAIATALRTNSTIYINRTLLNERGKNICGEDLISKE